MPSILEYAETEFSLLAEKPFTDVDSLLLSQFSYMNLSAFEDELKCENKIEIRELLKAERFEKLMFHVRDTKSNMRLLYLLWRQARAGATQKSATSLKSCVTRTEERFAPSPYTSMTANACAVFRGTDATLPIGWKRILTWHFARHPLAGRCCRLCDKSFAKSFPANCFDGPLQRRQFRLLRGHVLQPGIKSVLSASTRSTAPASSATRSNPKNMGAFKAAYIRSFQRLSSSACCLKITVHTRCGKQNQMGIMQHDPFLWQVTDGGIPYAGGNFQRRKYMNKTLSTAGSLA